QDRVIHVSCAELFRANIKRAELLILPECGHMPITEQVRAWIKPYMTFLEKAGEPVATRDTACLLPEAPEHCPGACAMDYLRIAKKCANGVHSWQSLAFFGSSGNPQMAQSPDFSGSGYNKDTYV